MDARALWVAHSAMAACKTWAQGSEWETTISHTLFPEVVRELSGGSPGGARRLLFDLLNDLDSQHGSAFAKNKVDQLLSLIENPGRPPPQDVPLPNDRRHFILVHMRILASLQRAPEGNHPAGYALLCISDRWLTLAIVRGHLRGGLPRSHGHIRANEAPGELCDRKRRRHGASLFARGNL